MQHLIRNNFFWVQRIIARIPFAFMSNEKMLEKIIRNSVWTYLDAYFFDEIRYIIGNIFIPYQTISAILVGCSRKSTVFQWNLWHSACILACKEKLKHIKQKRSRNAREKTNFNKRTIQGISCSSFGTITAYKVWLSIWEIMTYHYRSAIGECMSSENKKIYFLLCFHRYWNLILKWKE